MIKNMDALEFIKSLEDESIDLVLTDPPYNISKDNNLNTMKSANRQGVDFGEWDKGFDLNSWIELIVPKIKKGGSMIFFNSWLHLSEMNTTANNAGLETKDLIRWIKSNPMPRNRDRRYIVDYEVAVWLVKKGGKWTFNRLNDTYDRPQYDYPAPSSKIRIHPTQKPVPLLEEMLQRHTNKGDLVVDPFAGSGSTAIACINQGRQYNINDVDTEMIKNAEKWIEKTKQENSLSLID